MKICIIGASGHWGYALEQLTKHTVVGIAPGFSEEDMTPVIERLKTKNITTRLYDNYNELIELCDVAIVNTRIDLNAVISAEFLKKDVYVFSEKPLAISIEQLDMLKEVHSKSKAFISAMFGIRYEPWFLTMKEAISDMGEIRMLNGQKSYKLGIRPDFYKKRETFGGIIPWVAIHAMDWIYSISGAKFQSINALANNLHNCGNGDMDMTSLCQFEMDNGILASVNADFYRPSGASTHDDDRLRVVCTNGVLEYAHGTVTKIDKDGEHILEQKEAQDIFELFLRRVKGEDVGVTPEDSFYMTREALKARDSAYKNQTK